MSRRLRIPDTATCTFWASGKIPDGPMAGADVHFELFSGYASHGYRSEYQRIPQRWYQIRVPEHKVRQAFGYSGKRYQQAGTDLQQNLSDFTKAGGALTVHKNRTACGCGGLCDSGEPCPMSYNAHQILVPSPKASV